MYTYDTMKYNDKSIEADNSSLYFVEKKTYATSSLLLHIHRIVSHFRLTLVVC